MAAVQVFGKEAHNKIDCDLALNDNSGIHIKVILQQGIAPASGKRSSFHVGIECIIEHFADKFAQEALST